jgi:hypothetical protein
MLPAATVIDGYAMKQQGRAGEALGISLYSGFIGGLFGLVVLVLLTERLSTLALAFTPAAYFALGILGLSVIAALSGESLVKGFMAGVLGLMIATIGTDPVTGTNRFTFNQPDLLSGIPPILVMVGALRDCGAARAERRHGMELGAARARPHHDAEPEDVETHRAATGDRLGNRHDRRRGPGRRRDGLLVSRLQRSAPLVTTSRGIRSWIAGRRRGARRRRTTRSPARR